MKKGLFLTLATLVFCVFSSTARSQSTDWLVGKWIVVVEAAKETRAMEILKVDDRMKVTGNYGLTGKKLWPIEEATLSVSVKDGSFDFVFDTAAKTKITVSRSRDYRMEGLFAPSKGKPVKVVLWKNEVVPPSVPKIKGFLGDRSAKGAWQNGLEARLQIAQADADVAAVLYSWGDLPGENIKGGASWYNARMVKGELRFGSSSKEFIFELELSQKRLAGELFIGGNRVNSIFMYPEKGE